MADSPISITNALSPTTATTPATATLTSGMSASEAKQILDSLGINVNDVLSSQNISQTIKKPATAPDDLLGIRSDLYNTLGVNTAQQNYQTQYAGYLNATNQLNKDITALGGRPVSLSKVVGTQGQLARVRQGDIEALRNATDIAMQAYTAKKSEADTQFSIKEGEIKDKRSLQAQYPSAGIKVSDSFDKAFGKIAKQAEKEKKDAYKQELKRMAMSLGISKTKVSTSELEKKIAKVNKASLEMAKRESELKIRSIEADIANTYSTMANRAKGDDLADLKRRAMELDIAQAEKNLNQPELNPLEQQQYEVNQQQIESAQKYEEDLQTWNNNWSWWNPTTWGGKPKNPSEE